MSAPSRNALDTAASRWLLAGLAVTAVAYSRILGHGLVNFDDNIHLYQNPFLSPVTAEGWLRLLTSSYKQLYVPTTYSFWAGLAATSEALGRPFAPPLFHAASLLLHLVAGASLVFPLARRWLGDGRAAALVTAVFWLHPIQVEAVAWVSAQKDLLSATLALLAMRLVASERPRPGWAAATFVAATFAKPSVVSAPVAFALLSWGYGGLSARKATRIAGAGLFLALPAIAVTVSLQSSGGLPFSPPPVLARLPLALEALGFYVVKLALPWPLLVDHGLSPAGAAGSPFRAACLVAGTALVSLVAWRLSRGDRRAAGPAAAVAALLPVLGFFPFVHQTLSTVAERYAYLAVFPASLAAGSFALAWAGRRAGGSQAPERAPLPWLGLLAGLALLCFFQAGVWRDNHSLYRHVLRHRESWLAHNNLASALEMEERYDEALHHYARSVALHPQSETWNNVGVVWLKKGRPDEAATVLAAGLARFPGSASLAHNLGAALARLGRTEEAEAAFLASLRIDPTLLSARDNLRKLREQSVPRAAEAKDG